MSRRSWLPLATVIVFPAFIGLAVVAPIPGVHKRLMLLGTIDLPAASAVADSLQRRTAGLPGSSDLFIVAMAIATRHDRPRPPGHA
jgi:hypothetical protein